jgi:hypothetical protein
MTYIYFYYDRVCAKKLSGGIMKVFFIFIALLGLSSKTWAWGSLGHRTTGAVAERHLCPHAKSEVSRILNGESLAETSTWADDVRSVPEYSYLNPWHYVSLVGSTYQENPPAPRGDIVTAINAQISGIRAGTDEEKKLALRLLVHFVGDAHQPFHAGKKEDHGGNSYDVEWFGRPKSLHWVWDNGMIDMLGLSFSELTAFIDAPEKPLPLVTQLNAAEWINESARLTFDVYPQSLTEALPVVGYTYYDQNIETVKRRLREAGVRLAQVLNHELGCN